MITKTYSSLICFAKYFYCVDFNSKLSVKWAIQRKNMGKKYVVSLIVAILGGLAISYLTSLIDSMKKNLKKNELKVLKE